MIEELTKDKIKDTSILFFEENETNCALNGLFEKNLLTAYSSLINNNKTKYRVSLNDSVKILWNPNYEIEVLKGTIIDYSNINSVSLNYVLTKKLFFVNEFIYNLQINQNENVIDDSLDYVFDKIDELLINGDFYLINSLLDKIDVNMFDVELLIGILTITSPWRENLTLRTAFYEKVESRVHEIYHFDESKKILNGLE